MSCKCKYSPKYHREDCPVYDVYGRLKSDFIDSCLDWTEGRVGQIKSRLNRKRQSTIEVCFIDSSTIDGAILKKLKEKKS